VRAAAAHGTAHAGMAAGEPAEANFVRPDRTAPSVQSLQKPCPLAHAVSSEVLTSRPLCARARRLTAEQAERAGLAARVVPAAELGAEARALAGRIAAASAPAVAKAKDCVLRALETPLAEGLRYEQCGRPRARVGRVGRQVVRALSGSWLWRLDLDTVGMLAGQACCGA
jgi:enoyl-CoA hydratase/carnithine racemase